jgi:mycothiol system anti-sigma-R factor
MSCVEFVKYIHEFVDNELEKPLSGGMEKHLEHCDNCRQKYEFEKEYRSLVKAYCVNVTAPEYLKSRILKELHSIDVDNAFVVQKTEEGVYNRTTKRIVPFSSRSYAIAASVLLSIAGGIFYYTNHFQTDSAFIVDNVVKNHVVAVNDNRLVFNEETSVVEKGNNYADYNKTANTAIFPNDVMRVRAVGGVPVKLCGTNSSCVVFNKGGNKLSLQIVKNKILPTKNLEKALFGPKVYYIGNRQGFNSVLWEENGTTYCLTSDINKNEMLRLAATLTSR